MRRSVALLLAAFLFVLPPAALAQNAGDEQYADPFGQTDNPGNSQEQPAPEPAPAPATPAPAPAEEQAVASQQADSPTLPATGLPADLLVSAGAILFASGAALRRRVS